MFNWFKKKKDVEEKQEEAVVMEEEVKTATEEPVEKAAEGEGTPEPETEKLEQ